MAIFGIGFNFRVHFWTQHFISIATFGIGTHFGVHFWTQNLISMATFGNRYSFSCPLLDSRSDFHGHIWDRYSCFVSRSGLQPRFAVIAGWIASTRSNRARGGQMRGRLRARPPGEQQIRNRTIIYENPYFC